MLVSLLVKLSKEGAMLKVNFEKRSRYTSQLPATPCTDKMRQDVERVASITGTSFAEIQRQALLFFLDKIDSEAITHDSGSNVCVEE